jgi:hypothetical protein
MAAGNLLSSQTSCLMSVWGGDSLGSNIFSFAAMFTTL